MRQILFKDNTSVYVSLSTLHGSFQIETLRLIEFWGRSLGDGGDTLSRRRPPGTIWPQQLGIWSWPGFAFENRVKEETGVLDL